MSDDPEQVEERLGALGTLGSGNKKQTGLKFRTHRRRRWTVNFSSGGVIDGSSATFVGCTTCINIWRRVFPHTHTRRGGLHWPNALSEMSCGWSAVHSSQDGQKSFTCCGTLGTGGASCVSFRRRRRLIMRQAVLNVFVLILFGGNSGRFAAHRRGEGRPRMTETPGRPMISPTVKRAEKYERTAGRNDKPSLAASKSGYTSTKECTVYRRRIYKRQKRAETRGWRKEAAWVLCVSQGEDEGRQRTAGLQSAADTPHGRTQAYIN